MLDVFGIMGCPEGGGVARVKEEDNYSRQP